MQDQYPKTVVPEKIETYEQKPAPKSVIGGPGAFRLPSIAATAILKKTTESVYYSDKNRAQTSSPSVNFNLKSASSSSTKAVPIARPTESKPEFAGFKFRSTSSSPVKEKQAETSPITTQASNVSPSNTVSSDNHGNAKQAEVTQTAVKTQAPIVMRSKDVSSLNNANVKQVEIAPEFAGFKLKSATSSPVKEKQVEVTTVPVTSQAPIVTTPSKTVSSVNNASAKPVEQIKVQQGTQPSTFRPISEVASKLKDPVPLKSKSEITSVEAIQSGSRPEFADLRNKLRSSPHSSKSDISPERSSKRDETTPEFLLLRNKLKPAGSSRNDLSGSSSALHSATPSAKPSVSSNAASPSKLSSLINRWEAPKEHASPLPEFSNMRGKLKSNAMTTSESESNMDLKSVPSLTAIPSVETTIPNASDASRSSKNDQSGFRAAAESMSQMKLIPEAILAKPASVTPSRYVPTSSTFVSSMKLDDKSLPRESISSLRSPSVRNVGVVDESAKLANPGLRATRTDSFVSQAGGTIRPKEPLLVILKGKKRQIAKRVDSNVSSLNQTDCFILDISGAPGVAEDPERPASRYLYVCTGTKTPKVRRTKAIETANLMKDLDYSGKAEIFLVDLPALAERSLTEKETRFWQTLLGSETVSKQDINDCVSRFPPGDVAEDANFETACEQNTNLVKFNAQFAEPQTIATSGKGLSQNHLEADAALVLDCTAQVFVWSGRNADEESKAGAIKYAQSLNRPVVFQDVQKFERTIFKMQFENWINGKELAVYNVLEVKQAGNIKAKDREWRVYDRGSDTRKVDQLDVTRMYDRNAAVENSIARNKESLDIDPEELINRDWGFSSLRTWVVHGLAGGERSTISSDMIDAMEIKYSKNSPLILYSEECYIFSYEYKEKPAKMADPVLAARLKITKDDLQAQMKENSVIYIWMGEESRISDQGLTAHITVDIDARLRKATPNKPKSRQVRVLEGKEPEHFANMIRGGNTPSDQPQNILDLLTVSSNPPSSVVIVRRGTRKSAPSTKAIYHISGCSDGTVRATQLDNPVLADLSSGHSYVLLDGKNVFVWNGVGAFAWEKQCAADCAKVCAGEINNSFITTVEEGQQNSQMTASFGTLKDYDNEKCWRTKPSQPAVRASVSNAPLASSQNSQVSASYDVRLWRIYSFINGNPTAAECRPYRQKDLEEDGVYILDCYFELFVWIGNEVGRSKKAGAAPVVNAPVTIEATASKSLSSGYKDIKLALETASRYAEFAGKRDKGRVDSNSTFVVQSGLETKFFKSHFAHWSDSYTAEQRKNITWPSAITVDEAMRTIDQAKFNADQVRSWATNKDLIPFGVDPEHLENHVAEADFERAFGMDLNKYLALPLWRQIELKKKSGLF